MDETNVREIRFNLAEPAVLGFFGLAIVTLVASSQKLGWTEGTGGLLPWVFFLGAFAQIIAALVEFKRCNTFGATAFAAYGLFWFAMGMIWYLGDINYEQMGFAFIGYLVFSLYMMYAAGAMNTALWSVFFFIVLFFLFLILQIFFGIDPRIAGMAELGIALTALYTSAAVLLEATAGFVVLPYGKPLWKLKRFDNM